MDIYFENIRVVSLIGGLKTEGIVKWGVIISQGPPYDCTNYNQKTSTGIGLFQKSSS